MLTQIKGKLGEKIKEQAQAALLSKKLATIMCDVNLPFDIENIVYNGVNYNNLARFFRKYDLNSHLRKLNQLESLESESVNEKVDSSKIEFEDITNSDGKLKSKPFSIVVEQLGKNYFIGPIIGVVLYQDDRLLYEC